MAFEAFSGQGVGWEIDDQLAGYLLYQTFQHQLDFGLRQGPQAIVVDIAVDELHRRRGIGASLIGELVRRVRLENVIAVDAQVWEGVNGSAQLFKSCGFKRVSANYRLTTS
jgi:GNAT superfamily N-acetyltransferase